MSRDHYRPLYATEPVSWHPDRETTENVSLTYLRRVLLAALAYATFAMFATESPLAVGAVVLLALALVGEPGETESRPFRRAHPARPVYHRKPRRPVRILADHRHVLRASTIYVPPVRREARIVRRLPELPPAGAAPRAAPGNRRASRLVRRAG